jgi:hypothetical protein
MSLFKYYEEKKYKKIITLNDTFSSSLESYSNSHIYIFTKIHYHIAI